VTFVNLLAAIVFVVGTLQLGGAAVEQPV